MTRTTSTRMNCEILLFILFFIRSSLSSTVLYPPFELLLHQLTLNSTLPQCTSSTCFSTTSQANFSSAHISHDNLLKLASYDRKTSSCSGSFLIASTGIYCGRRLKYRHQRTIDQFLGIYYAEIPRSLHKPVKKRFQYSLQNATKFSPYCMQSLLMTENLSYGSFVMQNHFHDNCLSLNIYRADLRYGEKSKAIMLFSHGGSNQIGGGSLFDGSILASEGDIIVVTMNFRLNYHGFLSSGDERLKGNYGLWDQLLAVEWIYENAHLFGGDRNRITFAGHSAGAGNVMLIPASPYCRGMIKRVISQSGTGLAPWSINRQPMKLIERLSREFKCQRKNETEMFQCIHQLLENNRGDFYRLHLSLSIADDNPYPVIDNDFLNDTVENLLQSDIYDNIDFLTGVTLNEGLYFAEYHIGHFYSDLNNQSASIGRRPTASREKRSIQSNVTFLIAPDIILTPDNENDQEEEDDDIDDNSFEHKTQVEQPLTYEPAVVLEQFAKHDYIERYINANFQHGQCYLDQVKKRYAEPGKDNMTIRLKLYIDLVSDLMFNFHMVHCLNLRAQMNKSNSSNYAYVYSHRPTFKARSLFRDHLKILPQIIGHFAELDYIFGVPLARGFRRIHTNVNMSYYNYSRDEEEFSRELIRYWSNFIKTGDPNRDSSSDRSVEVPWKPYTNTEHNYIVFQLKEIRNELNYFDSMYYFWLNSFEIERQDGCPYVWMKMRKHLLPFALLLLALFCVLTIGFILKHWTKKGDYFSTSNPRTVPNLV